MRSSTNKFLFGVSNASFQVEGTPAPSDWKAWTHTVGRISDGTNADRATDFWNQYERDFKFSRDAGMNTFRISIAWERIEPAPGQWDETALEHYMRMIGKMREYGLEPVVTLMHYVMPLWVSEQGGVCWKEYPARFGEYCKYVVKRLAQAPARVVYFMTLNEPNIQVRFGYLDANKFPPGVNNATQAVKALAGLAHGHIEGYRQIHSLGLKEVKVGFAHNWQIFVPLNSASEADQKMAREVDWMFNRAFMEAVTAGKLVFAMPGADRIETQVALPGGKPALDYLGVQNYGRSFVTPTREAPFYALTEGDGVKNDLGWELVPEALYLAVKQIAEYGFPVMISETGCADRSDRVRSNYLRDNFKALRRLLDEKVALFGYIHWSLTDNFEWAFGVAPRFGLIEVVDYKTLEMRKRAGFETFKQLIAEFS